MNRIRVLFAVALIAVLAGLLAFFQTRGEQTTTTQVASATTDTPTVTTVPVTTSAVVTATTTLEQREAEVEAILKELYFGWLDAIDRNDEEAVRDAVATEKYLEAFRAAMKDLDFVVTPTSDRIVITDVEILLDRVDCLVVFATVDLSGLLGSDVSVTNVNVLWPGNGGWRFATNWKYPTDLWQQDCDGVRQQIP